MGINHENSGRKGKGEERVGEEGRERNCLYLAWYTNTQKEKKTKQDLLLVLQLVSLISEGLPLSLLRKHYIFK